MATANSPVGTYEILVTGGEAKNYTLNYVNGTLTIETPSVINSLIMEKKAAVPSILRQASVSPLPAKA